MDVASGGFQQAEFAADLWQVHLGEGGDEYRDPVEFFRRTYPTESLEKLLVGGIERLTQGNGAPVVQLQTNFGGGKTHSMLAVYHLFSGVAPASLLGIESLLAEAGATELPTVRRAGLVGTKISPGSPAPKPDGTVVRTLWGEIAWQLGGAEAFARIAGDDERSSNPGDRLRELFNDYGPWLILIDEWVAYARQLHDEADLPGGDFETHFTFALTEAARSANKCLQVISLPASDGPGSSHSQADDIEVGGLRGRDALQRLRNAIGRIESAWRPATAEESFESSVVACSMSSVEMSSIDRAISRPCVLGAVQQGTRQVSRRMSGGRLRASNSERLPDSSGNLRSALLRLVDVGKLPAHPRGSAAGGRSDPQPLGERRPKSADPTLDDPD